MLPALAGEAPKTNSSQRVDAGQLASEPFYYTGIVFSGDSRGSGFVAEHEQLFFTAAHVVFGDTGWNPPPTWVGGYSDEGAPGAELEIPSRGYFRWTQYANIVAEAGPNSRRAFSRDVALAWGLEPFVEGIPASLDFKGVSNLQRSNISMITGYPAELDYTQESGGYFLHTTAPDITPFKPAVGPYLYATHISTGPGNSGGPVWVQDNLGNWKAGGVLVSGRPSETGVYAMSADIRSFLQAANPVLSTPRRSMKFVKGVGASSTLLAMPKPKKIPDGKQSWTRIPLSVLSFPDEAKVSKVTLHLDISTAHRGDLIVALLGPGGVFSMLHNGEGAGESDLLFEDYDVSGAFSGGEPDGRWTLLVQDRLKGDPAVVNRFELEIEAE
jgi:hypothetical protein